MMRALATGVIALALLSACDPQLRGECRVQGDCEGGAACVEGLCIRPPDDVALVAVVSPLPGQVYAGGILSVRVAVATPAVTQVTVALRSGSDALAEAAALPLEGTSLWEAKLSLDEATLVTGWYEVTAAALGTKLHRASAPVRVGVDKSPPEITLLGPVYPARAAGHPAATAFVRHEEVVLRARVVDSPAGLSRNVPPVLSTGGIGPVEGEPDGEDEWIFRVPGSLLALEGLSAGYAVSVTAVDALGHAGSAMEENAYRITRRAWTWTSPHAEKPVTAAPAIVGGLLVFGDESGTVFALDRHSGTEAWRHDARSQLVGHLAADERSIVALTRSGSVLWLDPSPAAAVRELDRCPRTGVQDPEEPGPPAAGPALGTTRLLTSEGPAERSTVFYVTSAGRLRLVRSGGFPVPATSYRPCATETALDTVAGESAVPLLVPQSDGSTRVFVAGSRSLLHAVDVAPGEDEDSVRVSKAWMRLVEEGGLASPPSVGTVLGQPAVFVTTEISAAGARGAVVATDFAGEPLWSAKVGNDAGNETVRAPAITDENRAYALNQKGRLVAFRLDDGFSHDEVSYEARDALARASLVLGSDGYAYVPAGPRLWVTEPGGRRAWSWDTRATGTGPASAWVDAHTPALSCDGMLYVVVQSATAQRVEAFAVDSPGLSSAGWPRAHGDSRNRSNAGVSREACAD